MAAFSPIRSSVLLLPPEEIDHVATPLGLRTRQQAVLSVLRQQLANHLQNKTAGVLLRAARFQEIGEFQESIDVAATQCIRHCSGADSLLDHCTLREALRRRVASALERRC